MHLLVALVALCTACAVGAVVQFLLKCLHAHRRLTASPVPGPPVPSKLLGESGSLVQRLSQGSGRPLQIIAGHTCGVHQLIVLTAERMGETSACSPLACTLLFSSLHLQFAENLTSKL